MSGRYPSYPRYEYSGIEWLGPIPNDWTVARLKQYTDVTDGSHHSPAIKTEGYPFISVTEVRRDDIDFDDCKRISELDYERLVREGNKPEPGNLLITKDGTIGRAVIVDESAPPFVILSSLGLISQLRHLDAKFLRYYLVSGICVDQMNSLIHGSALRRLTVKKINELVILFPSLDEQKQIASFLDYETAKIDALIEKQQQLIALLGEKRQAVISHAVTKGLNPDAPMRDSGVEWLGEVPEHWTTTTLKFHSRVVDCKHITAEFVDNGIPVASIAETKGWFVDLSTAKFTTEKFYDDLIGGGRKPVEGDIIYTRNATVGEAAIVADGMPDFAMGQDVCLIRSDETIDSEFLLHCLKSPVISSQVELAMVGSTFKRINVDDIRNFALTLPPATEQNQIVAYLGTKLERYDSLILNAEDAMELLRERRTALISAAVTGKIDVRDWKPPSSSANRETEMELA